MTQTTYDTAFDVTRTQTYSNDVGVALMSPIHSVQTTTDRRNTVAYTRNRHSVSIRSVGSAKSYVNFTQQRLFV